MNAEQQPGSSSAIPKLEAKNALAIWAFIYLLPALIIIAFSGWILGWWDSEKELDASFKKTDAELAEERAQTLCMHRYIDETMGAATFGSVRMSATNDGYSTSIYGNLHGLDASAFCRTAGNRVVEFRFTGNILQ